jgi:hypothetical protein
LNAKDGTGSILGIIRSLPIVPDNLFLFAREGIERIGGSRREGVILHQIRTSDSEIVT